MGVTITNLRKRLNGTDVYKDLNLKTKTGKITAIFGPNGSGKTTLFNIISGVMRADGGEVSYGNEQKELGYLFQNYRESLLPWRTAYKNLSFPLEMRGLSKKEIDKRISRFQKTFGVILPLNKYPYEMSGGQQQMLAILRTLIVEPNLLLLDEPFSSLDYENALHQRNVLQEYYLKHKANILIITHDIEEAVYLAEEIVVLSHKPTKVLGIVKNSLAYPRTLSSIKDKRFHITRTKVLKLFQEAMQT
jgi:NitT/TauT family transport system ATP-binding protein